MKRRFTALILALTLACGTTVMADEKDDRIAELEAKIEALEKQLEELQKGKQSSDQDNYKIGDTWTVEGQWSCTVEEVALQEERNEYSDYEPEAVYVVTYSYENLGYEAEGWDGLYLNIANTIVDAEGNMGYEYPGKQTYYAQETPVGAKCKAQVVIGVDHAGNFQLRAATYDGNEKEQKAVFDIVVE